MANKAGVKKRFEFWLRAKRAIFEQCTTTSFEQPKTRKNRITQVLPDITETFSSRKKDTAHAHWNHTVVASQGNQQSHKTLNFPYLT